MTQRDYLVRQLEAFTRGLAQAILLRETRREVAAALVLDELSERFLGLRATELSTLSYGALLSRIGVDGELEADHRLIASDLLEEIALLVEAEGNSEEALRVHALSFRLLAEMRDREGVAVLHGREVRLDRTAKAIQRADLDRDTLALLWRHHLRMRRYAAAEDMLFRLLEASTDEPGSALEPVEQGIETYHSLLELSDEALEGGGLSRAEVLEALEELRALRLRPLHPPLPPG